MSLYYEAESAEATGSVKMPAVRKFKRNIIVYAACFAISAGLGFYFTSHQATAEAQKLASVEKYRLLDIFSQKTKALMHDSNKEAGLYPFVGESKVHEYRIRFVSQGSERAGKRATEEPVVTPKSTEQASVDGNNVRDDNLSTADARALSGNGSSRKLSVEELFNQAVDETGGLENTTRSSVKSTASTAVADKSLWELPEASRRRIPSFVYSAHNYSTDPYKRTVVINGKTLREGGEIGRLAVKKITPSATVFTVDGVDFTQRALDDYEAQ